MIIDALQSLAVPLARLRSMDGNPRRGDVAAVMRSYARFGQRKAIVAKADGTVIAGNHQLEAARQLGWEEIAVVFVDDDDATARAYALADNRVGDLGSYDHQLLAELISSVPDLSGTGFDQAFTDAALGSLQDLPSLGFFGTDPLGGRSLQDPAFGSVDPVAPSPSLAERFVVPPFSVLDARSGMWQERKRRWLGLGIRSEEGRGENLPHGIDADLDASSRRGALTYVKGRTADDELDDVSRRILNSGRKALTLPSLSGRIPDYYDQKNAAERTAGRSLSNEEFEADYLVVGSETETLSTGGTSIFDPVLCELVYRWFCPHGGLVLDPFAGGSVRGIMAGLLGRAYVGVDLREEQIAANRLQGSSICPEASIRWQAGDSREIIPQLSLEQPADLIFSCPPYADLEVYSDDPADISNMPYPEFAGAYREIIAASVKRLAPDRFACIVIGDARDGRGNYYGLIGETVDAFRAAGCTFYNEAILVTPVGSLPIRAGRQFSTSRKFGKTHQNVLVFVKGDARRAADACGMIDVSMPEAMQAEVGVPEA